MSNTINLIAAIIGLVVAIISLYISIITKKQAPQNSKFFYIKG